jgi:hypothetical protein
MRRKDLIRITSEHAQRRLEALRAKPFAELAQLPAFEEERVAGNKAVLGIHRDTLSDGRVRIVIQAVVVGWLGFSSIEVHGFTAGTDEVTTLLKEEELWDFT